MNIAGIQSELRDKIRGGNSLPVITWCKNHPDLLFGPVNIGSDLLNRACFKNLPDLVIELLNLGIDPNLLDSDYLDAIWNACLGGNLKIMKLLISRGANHNIRYRRDMTLLHWAAKDGFLDICLYLISLGCDLREIDNSGNRILQEYGKYARPLLPNKIRKKHRALILNAFANGPHPWCRWFRRAPIMIVVSGLGYLYNPNNHWFLELLFLQKNDKLDTVVLSTVEQKRLYYFELIISNGTFRIIVSYLYTFAHLKRLF